MRCSAWLAIGFALFFFACQSEIPHEGAFDPNTPPEKQAPARVSGTLQLEDETDFAGIAVVLQNDNHTYSGATDSQGNYKLTGVVPGTYTLKASTKHFIDLSDSVVVGLGAKIQLPARSLASKKVNVYGKALAEQLVQGALQQSGGVMVTLSQRCFDS